MIYTMDGWMDGCLTGIVDLNVLCLSPVAGLKADVTNFHVFKGYLLYSSCLCFTGNEFGKCVYMSPYTGLLYDNDCNERLPFACKAKRLDYTPKPRNVETSCPNDWNRIDDKCYKVGLCVRSFAFLVRHSLDSYQ